MSEFNIYERYRDRNRNPGQDPYSQSFLYTHNKTAPQSETVKPSAEYKPNYGLQQQIPNNPTTSLADDDLEKGKKQHISDNNYYQVEDLASLYSNENDFLDMISEQDEELARDIYKMVKEADKMCCDAKDDQEYIDEMYKKYHAAVNMSASELEAWSKNPCSRKASVSRAPINRNLRILRTPKSEWTKATAKSAARTISYLSRASGIKGGENVSKECPYSPNSIAKKNWAKK